jgi:hypothetical protein
VVAGGGGTAVLAGTEAVEAARYCCCGAGAGRRAGAGAGRAEPRERGILDCCSAVERLRGDISRSGEFLDGK